MNSFNHFLTVTLLVITIALSSVLTTSHTSSLSATSSSSSSATVSSAPSPHLIHAPARQSYDVRHLKRLQQQEHHLQQQRQPHKQHDHHHRNLRIHNHQHPHEHNKQLKELELRGNAQPVQNLQHHQRPQSQQHQQPPRMESRKNETATAIARLQRINAHDYYNRATMTQTQQYPHHLKRRIDNDNKILPKNSYHHRIPKALSGRQFDEDTMKDVEMVRPDSVKPFEWKSGSRTTKTEASFTPPAIYRDYSYVPSFNPSLASNFPHRSPTTVTSAPPSLIPERRYGFSVGQPATSTIDTAFHSDDSTGITTLGGNTISHNYPINDPKEMDRRHICVQQRTVHTPVKTTEIYSRPTWKHVPIPCQPQAHPKQVCTRVQIIHEPAYRDVIRHKSAQQVTYDCCAGWMREKPQSDACMLPVCSKRCQNGGTCSSPDTCTCPPGFRGRYCENDINECKETKPCDQNCINLIGSYMCTCREGFVLQPDQESCRKIEFRSGDAFESRDMENDIETNDDIGIRLEKMEHTLAKERMQTQDLENSLVSTHRMVDSLKSRVTALEKEHQDFNRLQANIYATETRTNKLEGMLNMMIKCRNPPNAQCP